MPSATRANVAANKVRMKRTVARITYVLVEGEDDLHFLQKYVDRNACGFVVANGWEAVVGALGILEQDRHSGILGLVDADLSLALGPPRVSANCVHTDGHDLESMLITSPALEAVLDEYASIERIRDVENRAGIPVREIIRGITTRIGRLRYISQKNDLGLKFQGLQFDKFVNLKTLAVNSESLMEELQQRWGKGVIDRALFDEWESAVPNDIENRYLSKGSDELCVLALAISGAFGGPRGHDTEPTRISRSLRLAYEHAYFTQTKTYQMIKDWESRNPGFSFLL